MILYTGMTTLGVTVAFAVDGSPSPSLAAVAAIALGSAPAAAASASAIAKYGGGASGAVDRAVEDVKIVAALGDRTEEGGYLEFYYKLSFWASIIVGGAFAFSPLRLGGCVHSFHFISYRTVSYRIVSYRIVSYRIVSFRSFVTA